MTFDDAFERLLGHEGGYTEGRGDPGGETKFGISKRAYPAENIRALTLERAKAIYRHDYWAAAGCDVVPEAIRFDLFDGAVNSGVRQSVKFLQEAVGAFPDGVLGPRTLQAINSTPPLRALVRFNALRLRFMAELKTWPAFGRGWANRIAENLLAASDPSTA